MPSRLCLLLVLFVCFVGGCAQTGTRPGAAAAGGSAPASAAVTFMEADVDGDARITPRELDAWLAVRPLEQRVFSAADRNGDGVLTLDEWH